MTEQHDDLATERPRPTGLSRVDAVIDAVAEVGHRPVEEQVAVFEQVHAELRAALEDPSTAEPTAAEPS